MNKIEVQVFMPGETEPVTMRSYVDVLAATVALGHDQPLLIPDYFFYEEAGDRTEIKTIDCATGFSQQVVSPRG
jgi:hypothetical protein